MRASPPAEVAPWLSSLVINLGSFRILNACRHLVPVLHKAPRTCGGIYTSNKCEQNQVCEVQAESRLYFLMEDD